MIEDCLTVRLISLAEQITGEKEMLLFIAEIGSSCFVSFLKKKNVDVRYRCQNFILVFLLLAGVFFPFLFLFKITVVLVLVPYVFFNKKYKEAIA